LILADVNVLIYAFRAGSVEHALNWLEAIVNGANAPTVIA
jgi:predicted nucleic acid-binding protein